MEIARTRPMLKKKAIHSLGNFSTAGGK
jgi:hypothetical protein